MNSTSLDLVFYYPYIPSINSAYVPYKNKSGRLQLKLSPDALKFKSTIRQQLIRMNLDELKKLYKINHSSVFSTQIIFVFKTLFFKRDVTNCIKLIEDIVFNALGVNDSRVLDCTVSKYLLSNPPAGNEYIKYRVTTTDRPINLNEL